jgi:alkylhydroperoxidase/carboxymuconolactone decarboxylase family protein YurZ
MTSSADAFDASAFFEAGVKRMADALGPQAAAAAAAGRERAREKGDAARVELPIALTWGWLLGRPGLSERDRVLAMIAVDVARGTRRALAEHLDLALSVGITEAELRELFVHLGPYAGYPALNEAGPVLAERLSARPRPTPAVSPGRPPGRLGQPAALRSMALAVRDAAAAAETLAQLIGIREWAVTHLDHDRVEMLIDGRPQDYELVRAVGCTVSGVRVELLEPRRGPTPAHLALLSRGPSLVSLIVAESADPPPLGPLEGRVEWHCATGPILSSVDTTATLGYRVDLVSPDLAAFDAALGVDETWQLGAGPGIVPVGPLGHLGIVVADITAGTRAHAAAFGRSRWPVLAFSTADGSLTQPRYQGGPGTESYLSSVAKVGTEFVVEVIEPTSGPSRYREGFLLPRGPGVHHAFFGPLADPDGWDDLVTELDDRGFPLVTSAYGWDEALEYGYLDTLDTVGLDLELVRMLRPTDLDIAAAAVMTFDHPPT